jgi:hypothetical protein
MFMSFWLLDAEIQYTNTEKKALAVIQYLTEV